MDCISSRQRAISMWFVSCLVLTMATVMPGNGDCLVTEDEKHFVFFVEDVDSMTINLNGMSGSQPAVLIDARGHYNETDKGRLTAGVHSILMDSTSDWAFAVGEFSASISEREGPDKFNLKQVLK